MSNVLELKRFGQKVGSKNPTEGSKPELERLHSLIGQLEGLIGPTNAPLDTREPISLAQARSDGYTSRGVK